MLTRLATSCRSVRWAVANPRQAVEVFDGLLQIRDKLSKCSTGCCKPATGRRSVRWAVANPRQAVEVFDGLLQIHDRPSKCSMGCCKPATSRRSVRRSIARMRYTLTKRPRHESEHETEKHCGQGGHFPKGGKGRRLIRGFSSRYTSCPLKIAQ